jgi:hypothetical protein
MMSVEDDRESDQRSGTERYIDWCRYRRMSRNPAKPVPQEYSCKVNHDRDTLKWLKIEV